MGTEFNLSTENACLLTPPPPEAPCEVCHGTAAEAVETTLCGLSFQGQQVDSKPEGKGHVFTPESPGLGSLTVCWTVRTGPPRAKNSQMTHVSHSQPYTGLTVRDQGM